MSGPKTPPSPNTNSSAPSVTVKAATAATPSVTVTAAPTPSVKVTTAATSASVQATPPAAAGIQLAVVQDDPDNGLGIEATTDGDSELGLTAEEEQIQPLEKIKKLKPLEKYQNENGGIGDKIGEFLLNLIKLWQNRSLYKENGVIENENIKIEEKNNKIQANNDRIFNQQKGNTEEEKLANLSPEQQKIYQENKKTANENEKTIKENDTIRGATLKEQQEAIAGTFVSKAGTFVSKLGSLLRPSPPAPGAAQPPPDPNQTVPRSAATTPHSNPARSMAGIGKAFNELQGGVDSLLTDPTGRPPVDYMRQAAAARAASDTLNPDTMPNDNRDSLAHTNRSPRSPR